MSLGGPLRNEVGLSVCMGATLFLTSKMVWSYILPCIFKAWGPAAAGGRLSPGGLHLISHLVASWYRHGPLSGWSLSGDLPGAPPPEKHSDFSKFYSSQPSDIRVSDGGGSGAHVATFAHTYTNTTDNGVEMLRWS